MLTVDIEMEGNLLQNLKFSFSLTLTKAFAKTFDVTLCSHMSNLWVEKKTVACGAYFLMYVCLLPPLDLMFV